MKCSPMAFSRNYTQIVLQRSAPPLCKLVFFLWFGQVANVPPLYLRGVKDIFPFFPPPAYNGRNRSRLSFPFPSSSHKVGRSSQQCELPFFPPDIEEVSPPLPSARDGDARRAVKQVVANFSLLGGYKPPPSFFLRAGLRVRSGTFSSPINLTEHRQD